MKYFKNYTNIVLLAAMFVAATGCDLFPQDNRVYDGPPVVEFKPQSQSAAEGSGQVEVLIQLIGEGSSTPVNVEFVVDDSATTALPADYDIVTNSPVTIPSGEWSTTVVVDLNGTGMSDGEFRQLTLRLESADGDVSPAPNLRFHDLTITGVDE